MKKRFILFSTGQIFPVTWLALASGLAFVPGTDLAVRQSGPDDWYRKFLAWAGEHSISNGFLTWHISLFDIPESSAPAFWFRVACGLFAAAIGGLGGAGLCNLLFQSPWRALVVRVMPKTCAVGMCCMAVLAPTYGSLARWWSRKPNAHFGETSDFFSPTVKSKVVHQMLAEVRESIGNGPPKAH